MGNRHDLSRLGEELPRPLGPPSCLGRARGWVLSRRCISLYILVYVFRTLSFLFFRSSTKSASDMPKELATRISIFYCASSLSGAFSGLLAAAIAEMDGVGGYTGWQWIFILEGIITILLGVMTFFLLIDSPRLSGKWLNPEEIRYLELQTFIKSGGQSDKEKENKFQWGELKAVLTNPRVYGQAYILLAISACSYGQFIRDTHSICVISNMIIRQQIYPPFNHQGYGLLKYQRSVDDCPAIHCRRTVSAVLRPPF